MCDEDDKARPPSPYEQETDRLRALLDFTGTFCPGIGSQGSGPELGGESLPDLDRATPVRVRKARDLALARAFRAIGRLAEERTPIEPPTPTEEPAE